MNRQFYEFWGNYFINIAHGQKQLDDMSAWMRKGFDGTDELAALFRRCYGMQAPEPAGAFNGAAWQRAIADFEQAFNQFAEQWGLVTRAEHQKLVEKNAALEKKVKEQQATIAQLRGLLDQKGLGYTELFQHFKGTIEEQGNQFQALMKSISEVGQDKP